VVPHPTEVVLKMGHQVYGGESGSRNRPLRHHLKTGLFVLNHGKTCIAFTIFAGEKTRLTELSGLFRNARNRTRARFLEK
jgi:hypothetical protein